MIGQRLSPEQGSLLFNHPLSLILRQFSDFGQIVATGSTMCEGWSAFR